jgi:hypothetical protein
MIGAKIAVLLAALVLGPAMACASEEGSIPLKNPFIIPELSKESSL